jgi:hypothetical protein
MTRGEVRDIIRRLLENVDPRLSDKIVDKEINSLINQGQRETALAISGEEEQEDLTAVSGIYALPDDFLKLKRIDNPEGQPALLASIGQIEDLDYAADEANPAGKFYYWRGTRALSYWPHAAGVAMPIYYLKDPTQFSLANRVHNKATSLAIDDDDEIQLPNVQHQLVLDWATWKVLERVGMRNEANEYRKQFAFGRREKKDEDQDPQTFRTGSNQRGLSFGSRKGI